MLSLSETMDSCWEDFHWIESEKYRLASFIHKPLEKSAYAVLLLHGFGGNRVEHRRLFVDISRKLCTSGIAVMRFDYRGHGESPLPFEDFELGYAIEDAHLAFQELKRIFNPRGIGLLGLSMGGYIAVHLAAHRADEISSIALLSPALSFSKSPLKLPLTPDGMFYIYGPQLIKKEKFDNFNRYPDAEVYADRITMPILIVQAKDDFLPYTSSLEFLEKVRSKRKEMILLEEGGHVFDVYYIRRRVIEAVAMWFAETLDTDG